MALQFGRSLDPNLIKEGNDVYFECEVQARPAPQQLVWFHQVSQRYPAGRVLCLLSEENRVYGSEVDIFTTR